MGVWKFSLACLLGSLIIVGCKTASSLHTEPIAPRLIKQLGFVDFTVSDIISGKGISNLLSLKLQVGSSDPKAYLFLSKRENNYIKVETVNEYRAAINTGYGALTTADLSSEAWFMVADEELAFIERAKPSRHSSFTVQDLKHLSPTIIVWSEDLDNLKVYADHGMTLNDCTSLLAEHRIHKLKFKGDVMSFSDDNGDEYTVQEIARGDWDGDGYEDALILVGTSGEGSGKCYMCYVVSRTDYNQRQLKISIPKSSIQTRH